MTCLIVAQVLCPCPDVCSCLAPRRLTPSASTWQLVHSESRSSSLSIPVSECSVSSPGLPLVSTVSQGSQPSSVSPSLTTLPLTTDAIYDSLTPLLADLPPSRPSTTDFRSSGQSTVDGPEAYFTAVLGSSEEKRAQRLISVARGFSEAERFSDGLFKRLSGWSRIFLSKREAGFEDGSLPETEFEAEVAHRLRQLEQARHKIRRKDWGDTRLWLVCLAHEIEHISQWECINLYTSRGVDPMSAAVKMATKYLYTASGDYKRSRNVVQIMKEGGPASLLEDGGLPQSK